MNLHVDVQLLTFIAGVILPLVVGVITKKHASPGLKAVALAACSAVYGGVSAAIASGGAVFWQQWIFNMVLTWVIATTAYVGGWKPTGVAQVLQTLTANFGIGTPVTPSWQSFGVEVEHGKIIPDLEKPAVITKTSPPRAGAAGLKIRAGMPRIFDGFVNWGHE